MNDACDRARDLLTGSGRTDAAPAAESWLVDHLAACPACAAYARALAAAGPPEDADLESAVPDDLAAAVWPRLSAALATRHRVAVAERSPWMPLLAAVLALALLAGGWLTVDNIRLRSRLAAAPRTAAVAIPASPHSWPTRAGTGDLEARRRRLDPDTRVLTRQQAETLLRRNRPLAYARARGPGLDAALADGVTAAEALWLLDRTRSRAFPAPATAAGERS